MEEQYDVAAALVVVNLFRAKVQVEAARNGGLVMSRWLEREALAMWIKRPEHDVPLKEWRSVTETLRELFQVEQERPWMELAEVLTMLEAVEQAYVEPSDEEDASAILGMSPAQVTRLFNDIFPGGASHA